MAQATNPAVKQAFLQERFKDPYCHVEYVETRLAA